MGPKTSIKQHDFISGEPMDKLDLLFRNFCFSHTRILPTMTNPCGEFSVEQAVEEAGYEVDNGLTIELTMENVTSLLNGN